MPTLASTFLSHSSDDAPLVKAVAAELGKQGVVAWLDSNELYAGQDLNLALSTAIRDHSTLTVFVSERSLDSPWVESELATALDRYEAAGLHDRIKPVYIGDPFKLVSGSRLLRGRWLTPKGTSVSKLGVLHAPSLSPADQARTIASSLAKGIYESLKLSEFRDIIVHLDQRGSNRRGTPTGIPISHESLDAATLVFRPRPTQAAAKETIVDSEWDCLASTMTGALSTALGGLRWRDTKSIFISGNGQLGLGYLLGHHLNRSSDAVLYCTDTRGITFSNEGWDRTDMLGGGNEHCEANLEIELEPIPSEKFADVVLVVGRKNVAEGVEQYRKAALPQVPVAWVRTPDEITDSEHLKEVIADVTALSRRLRRENSCRKAYLAVGLPFPAIPLLAAHMQYVIEDVVLLEHRGDIVGAVADADAYAQLALPAQ